MCNQRKNNSRPPLHHTQRCIQSSDHHFILLIHAYKQKLKQEVPVTRSIRKWSDDADAKLQDCFASIDWNMFPDSSFGIEEYATSVTGFIDKCIDDVVPTVTVCTYPNQKPWITGNIRTEIKDRAAAFKEQGFSLAPPSDEPSNRQSGNTGLGLNPTTTTLTLVRCGRACKLLWTIKGSTAASCQVTQAFQMS